MNWYKPAAKQFNSLSAMSYQKLDCVNNRFLILQASSYKLHFGKQHISHYTVDDPTWVYPPPESVDEGVNKQVCKKAGQ